jgi:1,4-dihydroxy-2-naphthoate octaprenyltransferase
MSSIVLKSWISAARPRTLPLSVSGILTGGAYAFLNLNDKQLLFNTSENTGVMENSLITLFLGLITTIAFQVLSNFANDYGDGVKGTDNENRVGPARAIQSGIISQKAMKRGIIVNSIVALLTSIVLIYISLGLEQLFISLVFLGLGVASIWAAIKYTVGDSAYGYRGLGDLFVFIFFGPVSVLGIFYLMTKELDNFLILPAISVGLLSVAVLNLNNMRDMESDKLSNKNTLVVKLGVRKAKLFHYSLIATSFLSSFLFFILKISNGIDFQRELIFLPCIAWIPLLFHCIRVKKI